MRGAWLAVLRLCAWLTPFLTAYQTYKFSGDIPPAAFVGFLFGWVGWLWLYGLADLAEAVWDNQAKLRTLLERK